MSSLLNELKLYLNNHDGSEESDNKILKKLQENLIYINSLSIENFRLNHFSLSTLIHENGKEICWPLLNKIIIDNLINLEKLTTFSPKIIIEDEAVDYKYLLEILKNSILNQPNRQMRLLTYEAPKIPEKLHGSILTKLTNLIEYYNSTPIKKEELQSNLTTIVNSIGLHKKLTKINDVLYGTYILIEAFLERLSIDGYTQNARDLAEEIIYCAFADDHPEYGHLCRFNLLTLQHNPLDAVISGCLILESINSFKLISEDFKLSLLISFFKFFRNFKLFEYAENIYKIIKSIPNLNEYEIQKNDLSYLNLLLYKDAKEALLVTNEYSKKNINKIINFDKMSAIPWLYLICNLKGLFSESYSNFQGLIALENKICEILDSNTIAEIYGRILPNQENTKKILIDEFDKLHQTRNVSDHIHEVQRLQLTALRLLENSIETNDIEGIILAHRAMSDGSIAFELSKGFPYEQLICHDQKSFNKSMGKSTNYFKNISESLAKLSMYRHIWIGFVNQNLYYLLHDNGNFIDHGIIANIKKHNIFDWLNNNLVNFGFNDSPLIENIFTTREDIWLQESQNIRKAIPKIFIPFSNKHTIVFCDTDIACFPHNLLIEPSDSKITQAICNPLSLDNYLNYENIKINISEISVWAPTEESDTAILLAHGRLMQHLASENTIVSESFFPEFNIQTDLKVFICHGSRSKSGGFTGLYSSDSKNYASSSILGKGKVAVLFICHGGHINSDYYARSFQTLSKDLLLQGYEAVIAPSWSLNVVIPGPWMEEFLKKMKSGNTIIEACLGANNKIKELYPVESAWAAMHLFGNPNIKIVTD